MIFVVQWTLKSILQHHNLRKNIFQHSAFLMVQFSHPYMTNGKNLTLAMTTFVGKVMSLLFNVLSRFVIAFLLRSKCLNFVAAVTVQRDCRAQANKIDHCFLLFSTYFLCSGGTRCQDLIFLNVEFRKHFTTQ